MTLPAYKSIGSASQTTPSLPAGFAAGDFALLFSEHGNDSAAIATPSGWTAVPGTPVRTGASNTTLSVFYRFLQLGDSDPSLAFSAGGTQNHKSGVVLTYTGVSTSTPIHSQVTATWAPASTPVSVPGLTTLLDDCLVVCAATWDISNAGPLCSAEANTALGSVTERFDAGVIAGNGGGLVIFDGTLASHTTIPPSTFTSSSVFLSAMIAFALTPTDKTFPTRESRTRIVDVGM